MGKDQRGKAGRSLAPWIACGMTVSAIGALALPNQAQAQEQAQTQAEQGAVTGLDPIIVTARGREEELLRVPLSVTAINRETLERARITENNAIGRRIPNVLYLDAGIRGFNRFSIRGVGDLGTGFNLDDNSVGFFIDGIPVALSGIDGDLLDIERVEVLRGPQNGRFGRNAQAGAISIITADPDGAPERSLAVEGGNLGQRQVTGIVGGALSDRAAGRLALQYAGREGDVPNDLGGHIRGLDVINAVGTLRADLAEATELSAFARFERQDETALLRTWTNDPDFPRVRLDIDPEQLTHNAQLGVTVEHEFGDVRMTSLTGLQYSDFEFLNDQSDGRLLNAALGFPIEAFDNPAIDLVDQDFRDVRINQELRFSGTVSGVDWMAGGNFFYSHFDENIFLDINTVLSGDFDVTLQTQSYDAFAAITVPVTDWLSLDGEARYTYEIERFSGGFQSGPRSPQPIDNDQTRRAVFDFPTWRFAANAALSEDLHAYASIARGSKAGGFNFFDTDLATIPGIAVDRFEIAKTNTYEIGLRGSVWGDRLWFSAAGFFNETQDDQLNGFDFNTFAATVENASTETYGAELEVTAEPTDGLVLQGSIGYLHTEITDAPPATGALVGGEIPTVADVTLSLSADYTFSARALQLPGDISLGAEYSYVSDRQADLANSFTLDAYDTLNLRARYVLDSVEVFLFAENVTDEAYAILSFPFGTTAAGEPVFTGNVGQPRLFGGGVKIRF